MLTQHDASFRLSFPQQTPSPCEHFAPVARARPADFPRIDASLRLRRAIHANDLSLTRRILRSHPHLLHNPDTSDAGQSNSSLHEAARLGHLAICQLLVALGHESGGPALNEQYETALMLAARGGLIETVHYLCQTDAQWILCRDGRGRDAIMGAARGGHDTVVQILLTYVPGGARAAVRRADDEGNTALHFASSGGHLLVLRTLLAAGADADHENVWCWTPVAYSASVQAEVYLKSLILDVERRRQQQQLQRQQHQEKQEKHKAPAQAPAQAPPPPPPPPTATAPSSTHVPLPVRDRKRALGGSATLGLRIVREEDDKRR